MNTAAAALVLSIAMAPGETPARDDEMPANIPAASVDVWLVSTRRLPGGDCPDQAQPDYWHLSGGAEWAPADQQAFLAAGRRSVPTVFFVHGNRSDACDAVDEGMEFCKQLEVLAPGARFRFVIWSWPADRVSRRNRPDLQVKDVVSQREALCLARMLDRIHPDVPVSLVGYSYGSQTIVGAIKLLAGECYAGHTFQRRGPPRRAPLRAVLAAGAVESDALASADPARQPLDRVDRLLITRNGCDPTLKFYPLLYRRRGPEALGFVGPTCLDPGDPNLPKVEVIDVTQAVGKQHAWECYRNAEPLRERLAWYTFLQPDRGPEKGVLRQNDAAEQTGPTLPQHTYGPAGGTLPCPAQPDH